jgi:hypothetical protein
MMDTAIIDIRKGDSMDNFFQPFSFNSYRQSNRIAPLIAHNTTITSVVPKSQPKWALLAEIAKNRAAARINDNKNLIFLI